MIDYEDDGEDYDFYNEHTGANNLAASSRDDQYGDEQDYYDESRPIFNYKLSDDTAPVQKLPENAMQRQYEQMLARLVQLLDMINGEEMAFSYKSELQRIYNMLMACVVNDKAKSKKVCELLGQGFHRLITSPFEEYFIEVGVPHEWYDSSTGQMLVPSDFDE